MVKNMYINNNHDISYLKFWDRKKINCTNI